MPVDQNTMKCDNSRAKERGRRRCERTEAVVCEWAETLVGRSVQDAEVRRGEREDGR
jgi:hypothetical protein